MPTSVLDPRDLHEDLPDEDSPPSRPGGELDATRRPRWGLIVAVSFVWVRIGLVMMSPPFEMPDTASYRSGQGLRPPLSSALLSGLPDSLYVLLSAAVSTLGFVAVAWALWDPSRRRWSTGVSVALGVVSLAPAVMVYEHWLVPDSLLLGLSLLGLAVGWRMAVRRSHLAAFLVLCVAITTTKEAGIGAVVLIAAVVAWRGLWKQGLAAVLVSALLFLTVVLPGSSREGVIMWNQPADTQMTLERFRVLVSGLMWTDLSAEMAEVEELAGECGMNFGQLIRETLKMTDRVVAYRDCDELFAALDSMSQVDVLLAHVGNPRYVSASVEDGFYDNVGAMAAWSGATVQSPTLLSADRWLAAAMALLPVVALGVALVRRAGRMLAVIAVTGTGLALIAALVDPTSQDRHTIAYRVLAMAIALISLTVATDRTPRSPACDPGA